MNWAIVHKVLINLRVADFFFFLLRLFSLFLFPFCGSESINVISAFAPMLRFYHSFRLEGVNLCLNFKLNRIKIFFFIFKFSEIFCFCKIEVFTRCQLVKEEFYFLKFNLLHSVTLVCHFRISWNFWCPNKNNRV